jgi:hypothetical protein
MQIVLRFGIDSDSGEELFTALDVDESGGVDFHELVSVIYEDAD